MSINTCFVQCRIGKVVLISTWWINWLVTFLSKIILYLKVQLLIFICVQFGCSSMYTFWVVTHQINTFFDYFVCTTIYILMHNFIISYRAGFNLSLLKWAKKLSLIWYQTYLDMWSIFGVKLDYIVIFEKSCNSSTLLMELFMICGPPRNLKVDQYKYQFFKIKKK